MRTGVGIVSVREVLKDILAEKGISQVKLAEDLNITKQNLQNKMTRDNFSALELVEIADALELKLMLVPKESALKGGYVIDYPEEQKGKPKRSNKKAE